MNIKKTTKNTNKDKGKMTKERNLVEMMEEEYQ